MSATADERTAPATPAPLPDPGPTDGEFKIPWNPVGAALGGAVVLVMVGGSLPFLLESGSLAVVLMSVLFIGFASMLAGAIVYTSTLEG